MRIIGHLRRVADVGGAFAVMASLLGASPVVLVLDVSAGGWGAQPWWRAGNWAALGP